MTTNQKPEKSQSNLRDYAKYGGIAFQMMFVIGVGTYSGHLLDQFIGMSFPLFTLILIFISVGLSLYWVFKSLMKN